MARLLREMGIIGEDEEGCIDSICCDCWTDGCGCDGCFGLIADGLEVINPAMEYCADIIWVCGSPLAFPLIFFFPPGEGSGGWQMPMLQAPLRMPLKCLFYTICCPCGQWVLRRQLLDGDMSRYKLWQGYYDGPHCCASRCPGAPITIQSGTYGEDKCPEFFLCLEVHCLAGAWSPCCSFGVNRRMIKDERNLGEDPTEVRVNGCISFFSHLASQLFLCSCCVCIGACLVGCCAPGSEGAQECSGEAGRAASSCRSCAYTCWRGIWSVKVIANGCMSAQMDYEWKEGEALSAPPTNSPMDRGDDEEEEDVWWKKP